LDAAENETLLFKTQLREGNVLTWNAGRRKAAICAPAGAGRSMVAIPALPHCHAKLA
jgi:hypothetical protein